MLLTSLNAIDNVNLHKEVKISINGDKVQDAGGLLREWVHMIVKEIFLANTGKEIQLNYLRRAVPLSQGLFVKATTDEVTYKINREAD